MLTTHDMDEAAEMSDRVGIVDHGRLLALGTPTSLTKGLSGRAVLEVEVETAPGRDGSEVLEALLAVPGVERVEELSAAAPGMPGPVPFAAGGPPLPAASMPSGPRSAPAGRVTLRLYVDGAPTSVLGGVVAALSSRGAALSNLHIGEPSLEDVFIELTGRSLR